MTEADRNEDFCPKVFAKQSKRADILYRAALVKAGHLEESIEPETPLNIAVIELVHAKRAYESAAKMLHLRFDREVKKVMLERSKLRYIAWELELKFSDKLASDQIIDLVAHKHGMNGYDLKAKTKATGIVRARQEAFDTLREHTDLSYPEIGRLFHKDHSTVIHGVRMHRKRIAEKAKRKRIKDEQSNTRAGA